MLAPRRFLLLTATALLACLLGAAHAGSCPSFGTKASIRKVLAGGKTATLTIRVTNKGTTAVSNAGLALVLPYGVTYSSATVTPKPASAPTLVQDGDLVAWTGLTVGAKKTLTARVKLTIDKCAGGDAVPPKTATGKATGLYEAPIVVTTFTGTDPEGTCVSAPTNVQTAVRRPKTATNCVPPPQGLCSTPQDGGFLCGNYDLCSTTTGNAFPTAAECIAWCKTQFQENALVIYTGPDGPNCACGLAANNKVIANPNFQVFSTIAPADPPVVGSCS